MESKPKLPDKIYFKIGEVSRLLSLKSHVIRYWETEFPAIKPIKSRSGQRLYRRSDIDTLILIKDLLYRQKFTIEGARRHLRMIGIEKALQEKGKRDQASVQLTLAAIKKREDNLHSLIERVEKKLVS